MAGKTTGFVAVVVALAVCPLASGAIINGSFELGPDPGSYTTLYAGDTSIPGWVVKPAGPNGTIDYKRTYWQSSDGYRSVDLNGISGPGGIAQTFGTIPGETYTVLFDIASNPTVPTFFPLKTMEVSAAGQSQQFSVSSAGFTNAAMGWFSQTWSFQAISTATELWFYMISPSYSAEGIGLDNVSVTNTSPLPAVPEPAMCAIWAGLAGVGLIAGRRGQRRLARYSQRIPHLLEAMTAEETGDLPQAGGN